jgi:calcyclin binding protein
LDLEELQSLSNHAQRPKIKNIFSIEIRKLETEIININSLIQSTKTPEDGIKIAVELKTIENKRYKTDLKNYAWDQSDKFVKVFVTADGVQNSTEDNVLVTFTDKSLELKINDLNNRDYTFVINNLLENIVVEKSYRKIKTDMVAIYLKKAKEGKFSMPFN